MVEEAAAGKGEGGTLPEGTVLAALILTAVLQPPRCDLGMLALPRSPWGEGEGPTSGGSSGLHLV